MNNHIALIGAGQMATALARGLVHAGFCRAEEILVFDPSADARQRFCTSLPGVQWQASNRQAVEQASTVLLAVKPVQLERIGQEIGDVLTDRHLLVSIAAGVRIARLSQWFGTQRVVRVMPNTPCLVGRGASAYSLGPGATQADGDRVEKMMSSVGLALRVEEPHLDCVTGLSGSGPAYIYMLIEALADGGVRVGLSRQTALQLAAHTVRGAAEMVISAGEHPAVLKDRVTSPGGTTIAALQVLEERGLRAAAIAAVQTATERSREMNC